MKRVRFIGVSRMFRRYRSSYSEMARRDIFAENVARKQGGSCAQALERLANWPAIEPTNDPGDSARFYAIKNRMSQP